MKKLLFILPLWMLCALCMAQPHFNTGNPEFDSDLVILNDQSAGNPEGFKNDMAAEYRVPPQKVDEMLKDKMQPAEVFLALEIARISKRKLEDILKIYRVDKSKGWGHIAKQMGIKPGSPEFHALKNSSKKWKGNGKGKSNGKVKSSGKKDKAKGNKNK